MNRRLIAVGAASAAVGLGAGVLATQESGAIASKRCFGAHARSTLSLAADRREIIATVSVVDDVERDWEIQQHFYGPGNQLLPRTIFQESGTA